jgi:hypothetical protein
LLKVAKNDGNFGHVVSVVEISPFDLRYFLDGWAVYVASVFCISSRMRDWVR